MLQIRALQSSGDPCMCKTFNIRLHILWLPFCVFSMAASTLVGAEAAVTVTVAATNMFTATNTTKPGCQRKCGNLTIPYPFGIGTECSLNDHFSFICNTSYNPPKVFSENQGFNVPGNPYVLDITETQVVIQNTQMASLCYDSHGNATFMNSVGSFEGGGFYAIDYYNPFVYSNSNMFTVTGCHVYAVIYLKVRGKVMSTLNSMAGCLSSCDYNKENVIKGPCSGLGCCQTALPQVPVGSQYFNIIFKSLANATRGGTYCAYAFFAGNEINNFQGISDLSEAVVKRTLEQTPIVLDWSVGAPTPSNEYWLTCREAKKNVTRYVCQSNTECIDFVAGGYRCKCLEGYEGNPYLQPGCTDVDECFGNSNGPCSMVCVNTPGSYKCYCPSGYYGDGSKNGTGCTKIQKGSSVLEKTALGVGISSGTILLLVVGHWLVLVFKKRKIIKQRAIYFDRNGGLLLQQQVSSDESVLARMKLFTADELDSATDHFSEGRVIGKGGQGTVFKGMLSEGRIVAIKKSNDVNESQLEGFINEVVILSQINHRNVVKLLGCCLETEVPLLVYEFIPNGTLFHHIHYPNEEFPITWRMRLLIASDSSGALAYLHASSSIPILHRDIKSSNILLDEKYRAKISDFGTSKSIALDQTHVTTRVMGTFGYLDPEYFQSSQFTEKSDVYSFGVVLVELLTGQKAVRATLEEDRSLASWFLSHMENSRLLDIIDSQVLQEGSEEEFHNIANLASRCLHLDGKRRPTMKEVLKEIEAVISLHMPHQIQHNLLGTGQVPTGITKRPYLGSSSTFCLENSSLNSAELSLIRNPR